ncbi:ATP phosphoribosyltransferase regulatory subunit [Acetanaerobacterium elongatum]|uniref:ATP phosphoribosyltransferase regulatory subunit n=2 Tax=Acetanaerobacterium elongatum TaxID=258515 RepID=A0A1H0BG42_9FIRM|nr:ATP phosphoribosyltransferase regulatory subunit [Acetanaerobacterium elongatum]
MVIGMKRYNTITPEGIRDLLFEECVARRKYEKLLRELFLGRAYNEVVTAGLEFYDVFSSDALHFPQESMYKLTDNKGRLLVCRPDSTAPIARLVATRLRNETLPIRLFYNQDVYQMTKSLSGRSDEVVQMGIELIGSSSRRADLEVIVTALDALRSCNSTDFRLEIGHIGFFNALIASLPVEDETREEIRGFVETKNYAALNDLLDTIGDTKAIAALRRLPSLFGGDEVIEEAAQLFESAETKQVLDYLKGIYDELARLNLSEKVIIDLGLVHRKDYYTGIVFRGYIEGCGEQVLSGGRYDSLIADYGLNLPAIGFAADISAIASALSKGDSTVKLRSADVLIYAETEYQMEGLARQKELISKGLRCEYCLFDTLDEAKAYAKQKGISKLLHVCNKTVEISL